MARSAHPQRITQQNDPGSVSSNKLTSAGLFGLDPYRQHLIALWGLIDYLDASTLISGDHWKVLGDYVETTGTCPSDITWGGFPRLA
jgi:hypothetical protein